MPDILVSATAWLRDRIFQSNYFVLMILGFPFGLKFVPQLAKMRHSASLYCFIPSGFPEEGWSTLGVRHGPVIPATGSVGSLP